MMIVGEIIEIGIRKSLTEEIVKVSFVLMEDGVFPSELKFELYNEKIALLEKFKEGDRVSIQCRPRGFSKVDGDGKIKRWVSLRPYRITAYSSSNQVKQLIKKEN